MFGVSIVCLIVASNDIVDVGLNANQNVAPSVAPSVGLNMTPKATPNASGQSHRRNLEVHDHAYAFS